MLVSALKLAQSMGSAADRSYTFSDDAPGSPPVVVGNARLGLWLGERLLGAFGVPTRLFRLLPRAGTRTELMNAALHFTHRELPLRLVAAEDGRGAAEDGRAGEGQRGVPQDARARRRGGSARAGRRQDGGVACSFGPVGTQRA